MSTTDTTRPPLPRLTAGGWPRRADLSSMTQAEHAIRNAVLEVEKLGAHPALTDIVRNLELERNAVADFLEGGRPAPAALAMQRPPAPPAAVAAPTDTTPTVTREAATTALLSAVEANARAATRACAVGHAVPGAGRPDAAKDYAIAARELALALASVRE